VEIQDAFLNGHFQLHSNDLTLLDCTSAQQILDSTLQYQEKENPSARLAANGLQSKQVVS
jgi:hypothetical protein